VIEGEHLLNRTSVGVVSDQLRTVKMRGRVEIFQSGERGRAGLGPSFEVGESGRTVEKPVKTEENFAQAPA
jgi:hypothetical protein